MGYMRVMAVEESTGLVRRSKKPFVRESLKMAQNREKVVRVLPNYRALSGRKMEKLLF